MGLEGVVQEVLDAGRREAGSIVDAAKQGALGLLAKARADGDALVRERQEEAKVAVERRRVQELARAELEAKRAVLNGQKELLDEVFRSVVEALPQLDAGDALLRNILGSTATEWQSGKVFSSARDERTVRAAVGGAYAGTIECAGGVVIETADGRRRLDLRFETRLRDVWDEMVREVAHTLWPKA